MKTYTRLSLKERVEISKLLARDIGKSEIARILERDKSTISNEVNVWGKKYDPLKAHWYAQKAASIRNGKRKLICNRPLYEYVTQKLKLKWSPEQISEKIIEEFPNNIDMRISHESIYTYIYLLPRGSLKKELIGYLRQQKKSRYSRKGKYDKRGKIPDMISIEERPPEVESRSIAGHWEGDLIMGNAHKSAMGTIVERKTRTVILVPLKAKDATSVRKAFEKELKTLPDQMRLSMTYDNGKEMTQHKLFTQNTKIKVYFAHPYSPWERGTNENTNGLIRQYFPKGTDFNTITKKEIKLAQNQLNARPRKTLNWKTPREVFQQEILSESG